MTLQVHLPIDNKTQASKGFAYVLFKTAAEAVGAYKELDQTEFQGRLLHIIAASPKRENKLDEYAISKLPLKKQRELKRKANAATSQFSWSSLYMNVITDFCLLCFGGSIVCALFVYSPVLIHTVHRRRTP